MPAMTVVGLDKVQNAMIRANKKMQFYKQEFARDMAVGMTEVAKKNLTPQRGVDTGALKASIHNMLVKSTPSLIEYNITAGKDEIARGEGTFAMSRRTGNPASPKPTSEYAAAVEYYNPKIPYMQKAYEWALKNIPSTLRKTMRNILGGV